MKNTIRVFIMTTFLSVVLLGAISVFAVEDDESAFLSAVGIIKEDLEGRYVPDETITREELTVIIVRMLGLEENAESNIAETGFRDVPVDYWASGYVGILKQLGVVDGVSEEYFGAKEQVTYGQAIKMMITALGYYMPADESNSYYGSYVIRAQNLGLLRGLNAAYNAPISRAELSKLVRNTLHAPINKIVGIVNERFHGMQDESCTMLTEYLGIKNKQSGIISANSFTCLKTTVSPAKSGNVLIGNQQYCVGSTGAENYLGQKVIFYATDEDIPVLKYIVPAYDDAVVRVTDQDVIDIDLNGAEYWNEKDKRKTVNFSPIVDIIYNEKAYSGLNNQNLDLLSNSREFKFIDNDNDGLIDVLIARNYTSHYVHIVDAESQTIYFNDGTEPLELYDKDIPIIDEQGSITSIHEVRTGSVIGMMKNPDTNAVQGVIVSNNWVKGIVLKVDLSEKRAYIYGDWYEYDDSLSTKMKPGYAATFRMDPNGVIVYAEEAAAGELEQYWYLINAMISSSLDESLQLKLLAPDGNIGVYTVAKNALFNDLKIGKGISKQGVLEQLSLFTHKTGVYGQPVKVTAMDGNVTSIDTMDESRIVTGSGIYKSAPKMFYSGSKTLCYVDSNTKVIYVVQGDSVSDDEAYRFGSIADFANDRNLGGGFAAYDVDFENYSRYTPLIVVRTSINDTSSIAMTIGGTAVISSKSQTIDANGNIRNKISLVKSLGGAAVGYLSDKDAEKLEIGDFVAFANGERSVLGSSSARLLYSKKSILQTTDRYHNTADLNDGNRYEVSVIHAINDNYITLGGTDDSLTDCNVYRLNNVIVTVYDSRRERVYQGNITDLYSYEHQYNPNARVLACTRWGELVSVVLYK